MNASLVDNTVKELCVRSARATDVMTRLDYLMACNTAKNVQYGRTPVVSTNRAVRGIGSDRLIKVDDKSVIGRRAMRS